MGWVIWVIVAVVALAGELLSLGLFLASFGVAALATAAASLIAPPVIQVAIFGLLSALFLLLVRPAVLPLLPPRSGPEMEPRVGPIGETGVVTRRVDARRGQIRVGAGEFWTARLAREGPAIEVGREVEVVGVSGLSVLVAIPGPQLVVAAPQVDPYGLSPRELEVLRLVALGRSDQEIARELSLSPRTVHHHVSHILDKMNVGSRVEATSVALRRGLLPEE